MLIALCWNFFAVVQFLAQMRKAAEEEKIARQLKRYEDFRRMLEVSFRFAAAFSF